MVTKKSEYPIIKNFSSKRGEIIAFSKKNVFSNNYNLYHSQGLWLKINNKMCKNARKGKKPYVISVRGMLEPWSLAQGQFKKKLALKIYQYKDLKKASCLHATSKMEVESIRKLGLKNPVALIQNGVNISDFPESIPVKHSQKRKILFLSRIHPKKGIENLINAWEELDNPEKKHWCIEIVGNGDENYIETIKTIIKEKKLDHSIKVLPPVFGIRKNELYREASLFVLPTYSENFGIVIAEALANFTPVITTKGTPWQDLEDYGCGWWIELGKFTLIRALNEAISKEPNEILDMGIKGRKLIEDKYSMVAVAEKMLKLYSWILNKNNKPDFIDLFSENYN